MLDTLDRIDCERVIAAAFAEDLGERGDITSIAVIPETARFTGIILARQEMLVAGLPVAEAALRTLAEDVVFDKAVSDGDNVAAGTVLARIAGSALPLLAAERTALNLMQLLSAIATETRRYVDRLTGTQAILLDTRKTLPGLRRLSKYAVRCGGGQNHRLGLHDAILIKDNHIAVGGGVTAAIRRARASGMTWIEVECDNLDQVAEALAVGVERLLLDNMTPAMLRAAVDLIAGRAETEASGGVRLDTIRAIAESGVDYISVGAITQSAPTVDIGLDWS